MTRLPTYLLGCLCLQLVLAMALYWQLHRQSDLQAPQSLLNFDRDQLDKIVIMSGEDTATLVNDGGHWSLPELGNLAVNSTQLTSAIDKLAGLMTRWPVATTPASHRRFQLQEDNFQRRIQLFQENNKIADLLLGSSPGFRKLHLRVVNDDKVYALPLNTFDFPAKDPQWLDKTLLAIADIKAIQGADYRLAKGQGDQEDDKEKGDKAQDQWILQALSTNEQAPLNRDKAAALVNALSNLRVLAWTSQPPAFTDSAVVTLLIEGEQQHTYQFLESENKYYIKRRGADHVFTLGQTDYQRIAAADLSRLTLAPSEGDVEADIEERKSGR